MKKFLTMALALMMVLSLFAVPTMASGTSEIFFDGDFEKSYFNGQVLDYNDAYDVFVADNAKSHGTKPMWVTVTDAKASSGNLSVQMDGAFPAGKNLTASSSNLVSPKTWFRAGVNYTATFDIYVEDISYLRFGLGGSGSNVTWGTATATIDGVTTEMASNGGGGATWWYAPKLEEYPDGWFTVTLPFTVASDISRTFNIELHKTYDEVTERDRFTFAYLDNISVTADVASNPVTETNDYGDVYVTPTQIYVVPQEGYYVHNLTVGGVDVTASLVKDFAGDYALPRYYRYEATAGIAADAEISVTYGYYTYVDMFTPETFNDAEAGTFCIATAGSSTRVLTYEITPEGTLKAYNTVATENPTQDVLLASPLYLINEEADYIIKFDMYVPTNYADVQFGAGYNYWNCTYNGGTALADGAASTSGIDAPVGQWKTYTYYTRYHNTVDKNNRGVVDFTTNESTVYCAMGAKAVTPVDGVATAYYDNLSMKKLVEAGVAPANPVTPPAPTTAAVTGTTNNEAYGTVTPATSTVELGEDVTFTVTPKLGYYVAAATLNGENVLASFDAYEGGTYTVEEVAEDVTLAVEFAAVTAKGEDVATLPAVFAPAADTAVTFGKVLDRTDATSWGIELTKGGVGVTPYHGGSYHYKANATNANGQYAIEFIGLEAGTYQIRSYVYVNGVATYGAPSTFVVD